MGPLPCVVNELLTGERFLLYSLVTQFAYHLCLCGDAGMVGSRNPAGIETHHAGAPDEHILRCVVEHVPHVKHSGDVRGRDYYSIRFTIVRNAAEETLLHPVTVPSSLCGSRIIF